MGQCFDLGGSNCTLGVKIEVPCEIFPLGFISLKCPLHKKPTVAKSTQESLVSCYSSQSNKISVKSIHEITRAEFQCFRRIHS